MDTRLLILLTLGAMAGFLVRPITRLSFEVSRFARPPTPAFFGLLALGAIFSVAGLFAVTIVPTKLLGLLPMGDTFAFYSAAFLAGMGAYGLLMSRREK